MKIIILAAGKGERLLPLTKNTPKPLIDMGNGNTLLEEQIERIKKSGVIDEIIIVVGYLAEQVESKIKVYTDDQIKITTVYNPFYDISNNFVSLWCTLDNMDDDFLITNGDNLFSADVFEKFINENKNEGIFVSIVEKDFYDEDDMKIQFNENKIEKIDKKIKKENIGAESPGLILIKGDHARLQVKKSIAALIRTEKRNNCFWLEVFNHLAAEKYPIIPWGFDIKKWQEVDIHLDITKVKQLLKIKSYM